MSRIIGRDYKDKDEAIAYTHNFLADLNGSTISSASWVTRPSGITTDTTSNTTTTASIRLSGGTPGVLYTAECTVVTAASETVQACHEVQVNN